MKIITLYRYRHLKKSGVETEPKLHHFSGVGVGTESKRASYHNAAPSLTTLAHTLWTKCIPVGLKKSDHILLLSEFTYT
jgi:hypothetical protein